MERCHGSTERKKNSCRESYEDLSVGPAVSKYKQETLEIWGSPIEVSQMDIKLEYSGGFIKHRGNLRRREKRRQNSIPEVEG